MNANADVRNFKDFLQIYNNLSEKCFRSCVDLLNSRSLEKHETKCVDECSDKFIKLNHRFMATYIENQQIIVGKRIKEAEELEAKEAINNNNNEEKVVLDLAVETNNNVPS